MAICCSVPSTTETAAVSKKMVYYQQSDGDMLWEVRWYDADGNLTYDSGAKD